MRCARRASSSALLALAACVTKPEVSPWDCDRIADVPGLEAEMRWLRQEDDLRVRAVKPLAPATLKVREYAKASDAKCAADRALGAKRITPAPESRPWWWWLWPFGWET